MNTAQSDITLSAGQDISPARENSSPLAWRKTDTMDAGSLGTAIGAGGSFPAD